jgi:polar amino acid transport system substrate-binding protein
MVRKWIPPALLTITCAALLLALSAWIFHSTGAPGTAVHRKSTTVEEIKARGVLRVGYINFPPAVFRDVNTGHVRGHFVLAVEEIARQMGVRCEYTEATWATFAAGLETGRFDISIAPTFSTIPRAMAVSFTRPLMYVGNSAIVRRGHEARFKSIKDIDHDGIMVAVTQGEAGDEYAEQNIKKAKLLVQSQGNQSLTFSQVLVGRADIALGDAYATKEFATAHPQDAVDLFAESPYNLTAVCWAVRSGDTDFLQFVNAALDVLDSTEKLKEYEAAYGAHWLHVERHWVTY